MLAALQSLPSLLHQRAGKKLLLARLLKFLPHIDQFNLGQRPVHHAVVDLDAAIFAGDRVLPAFDRRRRRTHHHHRTGQLGPHHGYVAGVIARRFLLLVALVMLLVHQNQSQVGHGSKDRRPRSHHNGRIAAPYPPPLLAALIRREC